MENKLIRTIEKDINPLFLFDNKGKILFYNEAAEFVLSSVNKEEIFNLALTYSPINRGFINKFFNFFLGEFEFFGLMVGYEDDKVIAIRLYKKFEKKEIKLDGEKSNIYALIDLAISILKSKREVEIIKKFDPTIEEFILDQNKFLTLFNKCLENIEGKKIEIELKVDISKKIVIEHKKYQIIKLILKGDKAKEIFLKTPFQYLRFENGFEIELPFKR